MLERQVAARAFSRAWAKTGKRMAAKIAMMAITTRSSMSVKPFLCLGCMAKPRSVEGALPLSDSLKFRLVAPLLLLDSPVGLASEDSPSRQANLTTSPAAGLPQ